MKITSTETPIILGILTLTLALLLRVETLAATLADALFLGAGVVFAGYIVYRIIRGIIQPSWLDAEAAEIDAVDPTLFQDDADDDTDLD